CRDISAAEGGIERGGEWRVEGDFVAVDLGDGAIEREIPRTGLPTETDAATDVGHLQLLDPFKGGGAADEDGVAGFQIRSRAHPQSCRPDRHILVSDGERARIDIPIILTRDRD